MTHTPPQFRTPRVLIDEWRQRAAEYRTWNQAAADVYERCANELQQLDVHTEGAPAGESTRRRPFVRPTILELAAGAAAAGLLVAGLNASAHRRRDDSQLPE